MMSIVKNEGSWSTMLAKWFSILMLTWVLFLIFDHHKRTDRSKRLPGVSLRIFVHMWPAAVLLLTAKMADFYQDSALIWFVALVAFRYSRTAVNIWYWFQYQPAIAPPSFKLSKADCTVILPTVGPEGNEVFAEMVSGVLFNRPSHVIFSTNTEEAANTIKATVPDILDALRRGVSKYQQDWKLCGMNVETEIFVSNAGISNKRSQVVNAFGQVETLITIMADDTAIWHPNFLTATIPAFAAPKVGFVGTKKWVRRLPRSFSPTKSLLQNLADTYVSGFWNTMGGLYLIRHNFEIRATNSADGGVFCISGRTSLIRTEIVSSPEFCTAFTNEFVLRMGDYFRGFGPIAADDDNFLTRWVLNHGWEVKVQCSEEATMTTVLGKKEKFLQQCLRWSRTTFRQNPIALFVDRTIWWEWPMTVWTTYFPWMYNAALFWDPLMVYALLQTDLYANLSHSRLMLAGFVGFIWATKLVKTLPWFWEHPADFFLYFFPIPAYPLFVYYHSMLKVWSAMTFWDLSWSGRKLPKA